MYFDKYYIMGITLKSDIAEFTSAVKKFKGNIKSCVVGIAEYSALANYKPELITKYSITMDRCIPSTIRLF